MKAKQQTLSQIQLFLRTSQLDISLFQPCHKMKVSGNLKASAALPPGLGGPQNPSGLCGEEKILALPRIESGLLPVAISTELLVHKISCLIGRTFVCNVVCVYYSISSQHVAYTATVY
jgi:hypothetical protein